MISCDEIIEVTKGTSAKTIPAESASTKTVPTLSTSTNFCICLFINYHGIIDSCWYLLLPDKISSKTKTFSAISHHK